MSSQKETFLKAAIDFGATYSGYAFSFKHEYEKDPAIVSINQAWNSGSRLTLKQPTCVLCEPNGTFHSFGYDAEDKYSSLVEYDMHQKWYFFRRFKMVLHEKQAGIDGALLTIALEPEAAAMYCKLLSADQLSSKGKFDDNKYMVIDLGGETADITIHEKHPDGTINELHKASVEACGGTIGDEEFNQMIIKIIGARVFKKFCERNMADYIELCRELENKKRFARTDLNEKVTITLSDALIKIYEKESGETINDAIVQTPFKGKIQWTRDRMRLDADLFRSFFQNCSSRITEYISYILQKPGVKGTSTLFMVGGFSECQLMQEAVIKAFPKATVVIPKEACLAVVKGAVILGHRLSNECLDTDIPIYFDHGGDVSTALPYEIRRMDEQSQKLYRKALSAGTERVYNIRLMIVGHLGVGKTSLTKRLLNEEVKEADRESTEGIEIHDKCCEIDHETREWTARKEGVLEPTTQLIAGVLRKHAKRRAIQVKETSSTPDKENGMSYKGKATENTAIDTGPVFVVSKRVDTTKRSSSASDIKPIPLMTIASRAKDEHRKTNLKRTSGINSKKSISRSMDRNLDGENCEEIKKIVAMERFLTPSSEHVSYVTLLDFAGQFLFYTTHQAFMSWRTIYLLVTDLRLPLTDLVKEDKSGTVLSGNKTRNVQEYVSYWLNAIHSHVKKQDSYGQNVILVATHADKIPKETIVKQKELYFEAIRRNLSSSVLRCHLADEDFAVSNVGFDNNIEDLKRKIFALAQKQDYWGELIPARWLPLEQVLLERKKGGVPILDYAEVEQLNQSRQVKIETAEELVLFLQFEHDVGNIVFFFTEKLRRKVVLDPQWLIRGVTTLITSDQVIKRYPVMSEQWYEFKDNGRLTRKLIDSLWSQHEEFDNNKEHLLGVLDHLNIIAKPLEKTEESEKDYYWVPCMVHTTAPETIKTLLEGEGVTKTSTLCFESKTKFIHVGVFHRLIATCLSKWMPAKIGEKYLVFIGLCVLQLDNCHNLMVTLNDFVIQATVMRHTNKCLRPDLSLCIEIKEFLHSSISEISKYLCPNSEYAVCIMCGKSALATNGDRHEVDFLRANKGQEIRCNSHRHTHPCSEELLGSWEKCLDKEWKSRGYGYLTSERHLDYLAGKLGMNWYSLALQLGSSLAEIEQLQMNHPGNVRLQIFTTLTKWAQRSDKDDRGKILELVDALNEVQRNDLADELKTDILDIAEIYSKGNTGVSKKPNSRACILL